VRSLKLRDSVLAEGILAVLVVVVSAYTRVELSSSFSTWQVLVSEAGRTRTLAGWWYVAVAIPLFQFLLYRWLWRLFIWTRLLWTLSRMNLQLTPTHPDFAAGLGFLGPAQAKYGMVILAVSSVIASAIAEEILFGGRSLLEYKFLIAAHVALVLLLFLGPLLVFSPRLLEVKRRGLLEYGALANKYTLAFDRKWIKGEAPEGEMLIGSADIQSLADLGNSFEYVRGMRLIPVDRNSIIPLIASAILPMAPLVLTMFPLDELLLKILGILF